MAILRHTLKVIVSPNDVTSSSTGKVNQTTVFA
jgi:hypothetical protein